MCLVDNKKVEQIGGRRVVSVVLGANRVRQRDHHICCFQSTPVVDAPGHLGHGGMRIGVERSNAT